jgi:hypothetical protein
MVENWVRRDVMIANITRYILLMTLLLAMMSNAGCAVSRMYWIEAEEQSCVIIFLNGLDVYKEGIQEGQEAKPEFDINLIPGVTP